MLGCLRKLGQLFFYANEIAILEIIKFFTIIIEVPLIYVYNGRMTASEALDKLLPAYSGYYTIKKDNVTSPFNAEAEFTCHTENYVLVKAAKIADIDSNEFVYFSTQQSLDSFLLSELSNIAWKAGLERIKPYYGHRNSDVTLIVITESGSGDLKKAARKLHMSKDYKFGIYGWSNFKLCVLDLSVRKAFSNYHGSDIKKILYKLGLSSCK